MAEPGIWYDDGTVVELVDDYGPQWKVGLFRGIRDGEIDEESCAFEEFEIELEPIQLEGDLYEYV